MTGSIVIEKLREKWPVGGCDCEDCIEDVLDALDYDAIQCRLSAAEKALETAQELISAAYVQSVDPRCADFMCDMDDWRRSIYDPRSPMGEHQTS